MDVNAFAIRRLRLVPGFLLMCVLIFETCTNSSGQNDITNGPGFYEIISGGKDSVVIPFTFLNGKPVMELEINDEKAFLMIDNGILWDQVWLFGTQLVETLDLKPIDESTIGGAGKGDPTQAYTSSNLKLSFQDIIFYDQPVLVSPPKAGFTRMFPGVDGQLCNTFFKHFIVEFDFVSNQIILHNPINFSYSGDGCVLELKENDSGSHSVPFSFTMLNGKTYNDWVDIDFGGIYPLKLALNNKHNIQLPEKYIETYSFGAQGEVSGYEGKIHSMKIGKYTFNEVKAVFGDEKTSRIHPDNLGIIGLPLFMKFDIIFDYINKKIYVEPNKNFSNSFE